ncbi:hypothetical protein FQR65_LT04645 [Abscondita terminalis]|nr:hypothetical protein FQR65_LT04645 [Abscondita terminalis]
MKLPSEIKLYETLKEKEQVIAVLVIAAHYVSAENEEIEPSLLEILRAPSIPLHLELPKEKEPEPFYAPNTQQLPPYNYVPPSANFQYPVPSQELQLPSLEPWNPNNDPKLYYELPPIITKQELPTNAYPKKYNQDVHEKEKPFSGKPKHEISLAPITEEDYISKQKNINKVLANLAKAQNKKAVEAEKVHASLKHASSNNNEPEVAATGFTHGFGSFDNNNNNFNSALTASSHLHHSSPYRQQFHTQGHDGPHSYKWGYDTGKGHNRQFRYEEKDKHGHVKGHYGYYDKHGELQMIHYNAHPHLGFNIDETT